MKKNTSLDEMSTSSWECIAFDGERVPHGHNFVPGPDNCTACKCEKGKARLCRAALCQPPQDCTSFRVGESCCDFICLDGIMPPRNNGGGKNGPSDAGLRMVASAITAFLSLALLLFLIHRLRQRKLRTAQHQYFEDQLDALGGLPPDSCQNNPCCHNAIYLSGNDHVDYFLDGRTPPFSPWKPPSYYFQPNDAPPPYSEVVANDRVRAESSLPSLNPLMVQLTPPSSEPNQESQGLYVVQRNSAPMADTPQTTQESRETGRAHAISVQSSPTLNSTLLSDQVYESSSLTEESSRARLHSLQNPPVGSLNDLNRGAGQSGAKSFKLPDEEAMACSVACEDISCQCECRHKDEKCNICSIAQESAIRGENVPKKDREKSAEGERTSGVDDSRLRLRLDIPSSTSAEATSHAFSLGSISSRSSGGSEVSC